MQTSVAVVLGLAVAILACEGAGHFVKRGWPTFASILSRALARPAGRAAVVAAWLWLGWHVFVR